MQAGVVRLGPGIGYGTLAISVVWQGRIREIHLSGHLSKMCNAELGREVECSVQVV